MQIAAQMEMTPAAARECRGHHGTHFVPVSMGDGRWVYHWLSLPQLWFWRSRSAGEKDRLVRRSRSGCFLCTLQSALEKDAIFGEGP